MSAIPIATISTTDLAQRFRDDVGLHVWNVLTDEWFYNTLIPGSRQVPGDRLLEAVRRSSLAKDSAIVVYCKGPTCSASREAAEKLATLGYSNVRAYTGGLDEWQQAGFGVVGSGIAS
ncbi:MAG: rhodanese-like domain-containing protein [Vicinamibacteraceae bacterium]